VIGMTTELVVIHFDACDLEVVGTPGEGVVLLGAGRCKESGRRADVYLDEDSGLLDATVEVPAGARVEIEGDSGEVSVTGIAALMLHLDSGDVDVIDIDGPLEVHADSADVAVDNIAGRVEIHTDSGDIEALRVRGDVEVRTDSGDITVAAQTDRVTVATDSGDVVLDLVPLGAGRYDARSDSGDLTLRLPAGLSVRADLRTDTGEVVNGAPAGDDVRVVAHTDTGDITILSGATLEFAGEVGR
jgi:DUF4097 and DUF4098 domain-containing protein YvlB